MPTTLYLSARLPATDSPITVELAVDIPTTVHLNVHLRATESPMEVELAC